MWKLTISAAVIGLLITTAGQAKDKSKSTLPAYVLNARSITVMIDPQAGISANDPSANQTAQRDVEAALLKWGRFSPQIETTGADLIVVVHKGSGKLVNQTVRYPRQNDRLGSITSTDNAWSIGAQHGKPPEQTSSSAGPGNDRTQPQTEIGGSEDSFLVFRGNTDNPLDSPPVWRYVSKDGLHSPDVPAVDKFRKAVVDAEKAAANKKP